MLQFKSKQSVWTNVVSSKQVKMLNSIKSMLPVVLGWHLSTAKAISKIYFCSHWVVFVGYQKIKCCVWLQLSMVYFFAYIKWFHCIIWRLGGAHANQIQQEQAIEHFVCANGSGKCECKGVECWNVGHFQTILVWSYSHILTGRWITKK